MPLSFPLPNLLRSGAFVLHSMTTGKRASGQGRLNAGANRATLSAIFCVGNLAPDVMAESDMTPVDMAELMMLMSALMRR